MLHRRPSGSLASQDNAATTFDRVTWHVFMLAVAVTAGVLLGYGPHAALRHIADVLADIPTLPSPDDAAWSGQTVF